MSELLAPVGFVISLIALLLTLRLNVRQREEYEFFLEEFKFKFGHEIGFFQKLLCYNAALGGAAPKWHWIAPVVSSSVGADYFKSLK